MIIHALRRSEAVGIERVPSLEPWIQRVAVPIEGTRRERPSMLVSGFNPLAGPVPSVPEDLPVERLAMWSGWLPADADESEGVYPTDFQTWSNAGWSTLAGVLEELTGSMRRSGVRLAIRPHARHVVSDAQRCLTLLDQWSEAPIDLLLQPTLLLTDAMLSEAEDHLERVLGALGSHPRTVGVVLSNVERVVTASGAAELRQCPLTRGELDGRRLCEVVGAGASRERPLILLEEDLSHQIALARLAGLQ